MAQSILKLTASYADETKRDLEFGPFSSTSSPITNAKTNIATVNSKVSEIEELFLSESGAKFTGITAAQIVTTNETEINLNASA